MNDENLWREEGPKALLDFLFAANGEDYDAVAYDTKCDFDTQNDEAVRYIASVAMSKSEPILMGWKKKEFREIFEYPMPTDGSVAPYDSSEGTESVKKQREDRICREQHRESPCLYVPDASHYCDAVEGALKKRNIPFDDMTEREQADKKREEMRLVFRYEYLPRILTAILICVCLFVILFKLFSS